MQPLAIHDDLVLRLAENSFAAPPNDDALMTMPLTEAKHLVAAEFERRYLIRVMERAGGKISEAARLTGIDRTNFRRLLQRHGLR